MIDQNAATQDGSTSMLQTGELPTEIGSYRVLELLGQGGMGKVLLAESALPKRKVAIKLMLASAFDSEGLMRFRREMEALARLEHPGIARLYEVGSLESAGHSQPWYAMEYVAGLPLDEYVRRNNLKPAAVLTLMLQVARSIHFAHQRGVIHRDLKPSNIIVDASGQSKILDFGIARIGDATGDGAQTRFGQIIGTLAYMSPEQLSSTRNVDTRSDVYALGIVLYQLLSGELPLAISTTSLLEAIQELAEGKRKPLSEQNPLLKGEIELIVDTASHREVALRYDSAAAFADDIERFLAHRPLQARRPSLGYVFTKFVRRNPALVAALGLAVLSLLGATIYSTWSANRARAAEALALQARAEADARAQTVSAMNEFLVSDLLNARSERTDMAKANISLTEAIEVAAAKLPERFKGQAETEANILMTLSSGLNQRGQFGRAREYALRVAALRRTAKASLESILEPGIDAAYALIQDGKNEEGISELKQLAKQADQAFATPHATQARIYSYLSLAAFRNENMAEAVHFGERGRALSESAPDVAPEVHSAVLLNLARAYRVAERLPEAQTLFEEVLAERRARDGENSGAVAETLNDLGGIYRVQKKLPEAIASYQAFIALLERTKSTNPLAFGSADNNLGKTYAAQENHALAIANFDSALGKMPSQPLPAVQMAIAITTGNRGLSRLALKQAGPGLMDLRAADAIFARYAPTNPARVPITEALAQNQTTNR